MKRRDLFKWFGVGAIIAATPAPVKAFIKAITPAAVRKRFLTTIIVDISGTGDARTIQEGIDMLSPSGGKVLVNAGVYPIKKAIRPRDNLQLVGKGGVIDFDEDDNAAFEDRGEKATICGFSVTNSKNKKGTTFLQVIGKN